jgi:hypothetical protein
MLSPDEYEADTGEDNAAGNGGNLSAPGAWHPLVQDSELDRGRSWHHEEMRLTKMAFSVLLHGTKMPPARLHQAR